MCCFFVSAEKQGINEEEKIVVTDGVDHIYESGTI